MDTKFCKDCKHYRDDFRCWHELNLRVSLVTGKDQPKNSPEWLRDSGPCGRDGRMFVSKEVQQ